MKQHADESDQKIYDRIRDTKNLLDDTLNASEQVMMANLDKFQKS